MHHLNFSIFQLFFIPEIETSEQILSYIDFHFLDMYNVFHIIAGPITLAKFTIFVKTI